MIICSFFGCFYDYNGAQVRYIGYEPHFGRITALRSVSMRDRMLSFGPAQSNGLSLVRIPLTRNIASGTFVLEKPVSQTKLKKDATRVRIAVLWFKLRPAFPRKAISQEKSYLRVLDSRTISSGFSRRCLAGVSGLPSCSISSLPAATPSRKVSMFREVSGGVMYRASG